jgi:hypothetical protein
MMRDLLDSVLFGFVAISESHFILWLSTSFFAFACFSLFNRAATQRQSFTLVLVLTRRVAALGVGLYAAFVVTVLLMAAGIDRKYYFLLFEFFSAAWLPTTLLIASLVIRSALGASKRDADQNVASQNT